MNTTASHSPFLYLESVVCLCRKTVLKKLHCWGGFSYKNSNFGELNINFCSHLKTSGLFQYNIFFTSSAAPFVSGLRNMSPSRFKQQK